MRARFGALVLSVVSALAALAVFGAPSATAGLASAGATWPQFQGDAAHTGVNPVENTLTTSNVSRLSLSWIANVTDPVEGSSPVISDGNLYIAGAGASLAGGAGLYVFPQAGCGAPTCIPSWRGATGPMAISTPAVVGGRAYVTSEESFFSVSGRLNVFDAHGCGSTVCQPLWQGLGGSKQFFSSPAVIGGVVYLGSIDGKLYAFDAAGCGNAQCHPLWTARVGNSINSSPAVAGGIVYVASSEGKLAAINAGGCGATTCSPLWTANNGGSFNAGSPTVTGGRLFVGNGSFLNVFDANGCGAAVCHPLWRAKATSTTNTPAVANGIVYIDAQAPVVHGNFTNTLEAFNVNGCGRPICAPLWTGINFRNGGESSPVVANGVVYIGKGTASPLITDSGVFSYNAAGCGKKLCKPLGFAQTGTQQLFFGSTPAVVDGRVYLASTDTAQGRDDAGVYVFALPS